jgi:Tfp pilus assembly protein PilX
MKNVKQTSEGMALIVSVIVLTVVLALTLSTINTTRYNQQVAVNLQSNLQGNAAAQAAINEAQQYILLQKPDILLFTSGCTAGLCTYQKNISVWNSPTAWTAAKSLQSTFQAKSKTSSNPVYIIEYITDKKFQDSMSVSGDYGNNKDTSTKPVYRITSKAKGIKGNKETVIQSTIY